MQVSNDELCHQYQKSSKSGDEDGSAIYLEEEKQHKNSCKEKWPCG